MQGLSALEVLMLDKDVPLGPEEPARYRCGLAGAIAANVASLSDEIVDGWEKPDGWRDKMLHPGPTNDTYKNAGRIRGRDRQGAPGRSVAERRPADQAADRSQGEARAAYQRSGLQKDFYRATIVSLRELYDALQLEDYLKPDKAWMKNWLSGAWRTIQSTDGAGGRVPNAERADAPPLREVFDKTNGLRNLVNNQLAIAAGLTVGFNELDGD